MMESLIQDIKYSLRAVSRNPGIFAVAVACMALSIGINSAVFSIINAILLRPLPYNQPDRLVLLMEASNQAKELTVSLPDFFDWREQATSFEHLAAVRSQSFNLTGGQEPEKLLGAEITADLFPVLGVDPMHGRSFSPEDDAPAAERVVAISHGLWERRFGSDPDLLGKQLTLNGEAFTVVAIMPRAFEFPLKTELCVTLGPNTSKAMNRARHPGFNVLGRLKEGVTPDQAREEMNTIAARLESQYPDTNTGRRALIFDLNDRITGEVRPLLMTLWGAISCILLIACATVAILLMARAASRQKELSIRIMVGAGRLRIMRQLLTESLLLAISGGALGILLVAGTINLIVSFIPENVPRVKEIGIDFNVLAFTLGITLLSGIVAGLAPALRASALDPGESFKESAGGGGGFGHQRLRGSLAIAQVALALALLVVAGLMASSFRRLTQIDSGFDTRNVLTLHVPLSQQKYAEGHQQNAFFQSAIERIKEIPTVEAAAVVTPLPLTGESFQMSFLIENRPAPAPGEKPFVDGAMVSPEYFRAMGISLSSGRYFEESDTKQSPGVAIIDDVMADRYWPDEDPVGRRLSIAGGNGPWLTIVGVVRHVKNRGLDTPSSGQLYVPYAQRPYYWASLVVRATRDAANLSPLVRSAVRSVDADQPVANMKILQQLLSNTLAPRQLSTLLIGLLAMLAALLAVLGIYSVMSCSVNLRTREIGIRMALGAQPGQVLRMVLRQAAILTSVGLIIGVAGAFILERFISNLLYAAGGVNPIVFAAACLLLGVAAMTASYVPARRAMRVDPVDSLRHE